MEPRPLSAELVDTIYANFPLDEKLSIGDKFNAGGRIFKVVSLDLAHNFEAGGSSIVAKLKPLEA